MSGFGTGKTWKVVQQDLHRNLAQYSKPLSPLIDEGDEGDLIEAMRPSTRDFEPGSPWRSLRLGVKPGDAVSRI